MLLAGLVVAQLWVTIPDTTAILQGNWQSCAHEKSDSLSAEDRWGEHAYDYHFNGQLKWSFHMGPLDEFALFVAGTEPEPDSHDTPANLLTQQPVTAKRKWRIHSLNLKIEVTQAGGSRDDCQSYFVRVEKLTK